MQVIPIAAWADARATVRSRDAQRLVEGEHLVKVSSAPAQPAFQDRHGHYFDIGYRYKVFALSDNFSWSYDEHWCGYFDAASYIDLSRDDLEELAAQTNFSLPSAPNLDSWGVIVGKLFLVALVVFLVGRWIYRRTRSQRTGQNTGSTSQERGDLLEEAKEYIDVPSLFTIACLAKFAKIDGVVTRNEISSLEAVFEYLGFTGPHREKGIAVFRHAKGGSATLRSYVEFYRENCENTPERLRMLVFLMFLVAYSDGNPNHQTQQALVAVCGHLGFDYNQFSQEYKQGHRNVADADDSLEAAYTTLGCRPTDALNVIKDRYRKLVKDFHPDTVISKELPAEFVKFAEERFKQIQAAYETVVQARGATRV